MGNRFLYLIRHGQYDLTVFKRYGEGGGNLTEIGRQQATHLGYHFKSLPINTIHSSTMPRAIETATIISEILNINVQTTDLLREGFPSIPPEFSKRFNEYQEENPHLTPELLEKEKNRIDKAFEIFFVPIETEEDKIELLVCHGNVLRYFCLKALQLDIDAWIRMSVYHTGFSIIKIDETGIMRLISFNETPHIPSHLLTYE